MTSGTLYSYQAGTTTQQATFTDATGVTPNPNPIPFTSGARANIWLTIGSFYKFILCAQNDGASCAPADVLFSVDQVPGGSSSSGGGGPSFTGIFISSTASPATTGALRIANSDSICWRNAANSTNLCFSVNGNNLLNWGGGSLSLPQINSISAQCVPNFDLLWADNTANRFLMCNNGGTVQQIVGSGVDINTSDQVTQLHFGSSAFPLSGTPPTANQFLQVVAGNIQGANITLFPTVVYNTPSVSGNTALGGTTMLTPAATATYRLTFYVDQTVLGTGCTGNTTVSPSASFTDPNTSTPFSVTFPITITTNGALGISAFSGVPGGQGFGAFRAKIGTPIQYTVVYSIGSGCSVGPSYQVFPILEQLTAN